MTPRLEPAIRTELRLNVSAIAAASLLAMPTASLYDAVLAEAERNAALVVRHRPICSRCGRRLAGGCASCGPAVLDAEPVAAVSTWEQLRGDALAAAPTRLSGVVTAVLATLDERGLLTTAARDRLLATGTSQADLDQAIDTIREVGPPGVASASPAEGLLAQLDHAPLGPADRALAHRLLTVHAARLEDGDLAGITAAEGCAPEVVRDLLARLSRLLRPYPCLDDGATGPPPRPPDLIFVADGEAVRAVVTEAEALTLEVDPDQSPAAVHDARTLVSRVSRRWTMLRRLGDLLAEHHATPLLAGSTAFPPLTQAGAAARLGVHESTVSRAVAHRDARLVTGQVIELSRMFGTHHDARAAVAELCAAIPRQSDRRIAELLAARGIVLSRRTVAKYRLDSGRLPR